MAPAYFTRSPHFPKYLPFDCLECGVSLRAANCWTIFACPRCGCLMEAR